MDIFVLYIPAPPLSTPQGLNTKNKKRNKGSRFRRSKMASNRPNTPSRQHSHIDELRWVIQIKHSLEETADDDDSGIPVSVFNVPKSLQVIKPEAYIPQLLSIGPYHHWRPEMYEMERYKLAAAKRTQKHFHGLKLEQLVEQFTRLEHKIRAHYHRYLDFNAETLSWLMVVDASLLLEFLQIYTVDDDGKALGRVTSSMSHLVDSAGRKSAHNLILRDIMMLENQLPLFLLRKVIEAQCNSTQEADDMLTKMLTGFMKELSPFKMLDSFPVIDVTKHAHLLELLYSVLIPKPENSGDDNNNNNNYCNDDNDGIEEQVEKISASKQNLAGGCGSVKQLLGATWKIVPSLNSQQVRSVLKPVTFLVKVPWKMLTTLPGFSAMKQPIEFLFTSQGEGSSKRDDGAGSSTTKISKPPLIEEIMIPSVSDLVDVGVKFSPTNGDLTTIVFDCKTLIFYLPTVSLDINTEIVLRNLVAYEAAAASGPLVFARYIELMNGIIDTDEDVMILRQNGVILNRMKSDLAVADLWNGMSKSVRLTKVPFLDKAIEDVNKYYSSRWRVKTKKFMKKYIFNSWQFLTFLAAILMLLLTILQAFCSVYTCSRWFGRVVAVEKP